MASWDRIARRIRVPLGFAFAVFFLWRADPGWSSIVAGSIVVALGIWLRALASGHVRKDAELTTTGPYAYTRNPLYLGSMIMAAGFALAARSLLVVIALLALFFLIYLPTIRSEENYLRQAFPGYEAYAQSVPRLFPRMRAHGGDTGGFSRQLYMQHREYNAILGAAAVMAALAVKILLRRS